MSQQEEAHGSRRGRFEIKSRPRPGSFNTGAPREPRIIAPPPATVRRNSATTGAAAAVAASSSDLINFNSPSPVEKKQSMFDEFNSSSVRTSIEHRFSSSSSQQKIVSVATSSVTVTNQQQAVVPFPSQFPSPPPPVRPPRSIYNSTSLRRSESEIQTPLAITDGSNIDILKLLGKQDNSNLIDLNPSDALYVPTRVSVLEAFDPLMTQHINSPNDAAQTADDQESQCSSIYDVYDPFEYMNAPTREVSTHVEPVYATVSKKGSPVKPVASTDGPPPLPPRSVSLTDCRRPSLEKRVMKKL